MPSAGSVVPHGMKTAKLQLRPLRVEDELSFRKAVAEFARESPPWQFAFGFDDSRPFAEYVDQLARQSRGIDLPAGFVPNTFLVGIVAGVVVGRLSLRHALNRYLETVGGHIGYGVVPSQRQRGYAGEMLRQAIPLAASLGISDALITCDTDNLASRRVIEACGGVFEGIVDCPESGKPKRRYWLRTSASSSARLFEGFR
jgi:predicted acetyltransferase